MRGSSALLSRDNSSPDIVSFMKFPKTSDCLEPAGFVERHSNEGMISDDSGEPASPNQLTGGPRPDQPIRCPINVVHSDGSQNKVHFVIDDIKRMSRESLSEIHHLLCTPLHVTTQGYLDNLEDSNIHRTDCIHL